MADAAVGFLLENLKQLLVYNAELILDVKDQVECLYNEMLTLKAFVRDSSEKRSEYETVKVLVRRIRDVTYKAEDAIDGYIAQIAVQKSKRGIRKVMHIFDSPGRLRAIAKDIEEIMKEVKEIYNNKLYGFEALQIGDSNRGDKQKRAPVVEEEFVVGFDEEAKTIIGQLTSESKDLEVVSIIGMAGLGKTTLARKVFTDPDIEYEFFTRAWVYVSQQYSRKEVFLAILGCITQVTDSMYNMTDDRLAQELREELGKGRYLIALDDVWTNKAWDDLKSAFPNDKESQSRILLTSRHYDVCKHAGSDPHPLRFLEPHESWELLEHKVFHKEKCPEELVKPGKRIAQQCDGLPLAIVVIAGILLKSETSDWWENVAQSVNTYVARDIEQFKNVIALSYNHLPYHLKACFLYFGVFPEDYKIPAWKLIRLWIAEGFIQQIGDVCLEDIAEEYLQDLVNRNLVLVAARSSNGRVKTCHIHDSLRDFCRIEATEEKFFQELKGLEQLQTSVLDPILRRLCIHSHVLNYMATKPSGSHVRSFLCYAIEDTLLPPEHISFIPIHFKLLRVLDIRSITFTKFPPDLTLLVHLRYIAVSFDVKILPAAITDLWNMQTLIVETSSRTLAIKADIWKMLNLRHLHTNASTLLPDPPTKSGKGKEDSLIRVQTLSTISPESCKETALAKFPNLCKLGIRGKLSLLLDAKGGTSLFDSLAKLEKLENLKLFNDVYPSPPSQGRLPSLPQAYKFPPNLKKLTLSDTLLDWRHMAILAMLPRLEVLKCKDSAFQGDKWEPMDGGFAHLKILHIGRNDLETWEASGHNFPRLRRLVLKHCQRLVAIPFGLADVRSLQTLEVHFPLRSAAESARKILKKKQEEKGQDAKGSVMKLLIYPPDA